jgi:hypothetical protein
MKKVLFGLALTIAAVSTNAQQLTNSKGEAVTPAATNVSKAGAADENAKNLQMRVTRVLGLDEATSNKIKEATTEFYQKSLGKSASETTALKATREEKFKAILGEAKYNTLNEYRAKVKANQPAQANARATSVDNVLLD